jgi:hypothetical protein
MEKNEKKVLFQALSDELATENISLTIICVGGFVLDYYGIRATQDVDAFFQTNEKIYRIIKKVGDVYHANPADELWLNNHVISMNPTPPESICQVIYQFSNLTVKIVPPEYVIGMKLKSQRLQDFKDVASLIKLLDIKSPFELMSILRSYHFNTDISLVLEGFSEAYGMDWLENFVIEHDKELREFY